MQEHKDLIDSREMLETTRAWLEYGSGPGLAQEGIGLGRLEGELETLHTQSDTTQDQFKAGLGIGVNWACFSGGLGLFPTGLFLSLLQLRNSKIL